MEFLCEFFGGVEDGGGERDGYFHTSMVIPWYEKATPFWMMSNEKS
jgi:hypothetical protein